MRNVDGRGFDSRHLHQFFMAQHDIDKKLTDQRVFEYSKSGTTLSFKLQDIRSAEDFLAMLREAEADVAAFIQARLDAEAQPQRKSISDLKH